MTIFLILYVTGAFENFWFWTFTYVTRYATEADWARGIRNLTQVMTPVSSGVVPLWCLGGCGVLAACFHSKLQHGKVRVLLFIVL